MTWNSIATTASLRDSSARKTFQENDSNDLRFYANWAKFPQGLDLCFRANSAYTLLALPFNLPRSACSMSNSLSLRAPLLAAFLLSSPRAAASLPAQQEAPLDSRSQTASHSTVAFHPTASLTKAGRYPEAIGLYRRALQLDPPTEAPDPGLPDTFRRVPNSHHATPVLPPPPHHHPQ